MRTAGASATTTLPSTRARMAAVAASPFGASHSGAAKPCSRIAIAPSSIVPPSRT